MHKLFFRHVVNFKNKITAIICIDQKYIFTKNLNPIND